MPEEDSRRTLNNILSVSLLLFLLLLSLLVPIVIIIIYTLYVRSGQVGIWVAVGVSTTQESRAQKYYIILFTPPAGRNNIIDGSRTVDFPESDSGRTIICSYYNEFSRRYVVGMFFDF